MVEVQYEYQSWTISQMFLAQISLQLVLSNPSDQCDFTSLIEELWVIATLFNQPMNDCTAPTPLDEL